VIWYVKRTKKSAQNKVLAPFQRCRQMDVLAEFKQAQKEGWSHFAPLETMTTPTAARLVRHAGVMQGMRVLDVACGTGVVAITAARLGAVVSAVDLTPQLLERARQNSLIAKSDVDWREADAEEMPLGDAYFDIVLSQFGHMFAPRPKIVTREMIRVLKPGGTIAFSTWPPELLVGRTMALAAQYMPPPPPGIAPPVLWGDPSIIRERLGNAVHSIAFDRQCMLVPALSPQHFRENVERAAGPMIKLVQLLSATDPDRLRAFRQEFDAIVGQYLRDNVVRQGYLLTRATKI
jgi:2-polyprenyl-3-methyl-5-hydroxy-6-metoxy-1,4-benzoquinol methylase